MIDSHCHLTDPSFNSDLAQVVQRARDSGVQAIVCVSETAADAEVVLSLQRQYPDVIRPSVGLHPERAAEMNEIQAREEVARIRELASADPLQWVAIGEVGLDFTPRVLNGTLPPTSSTSEASSAHDLVKRIQREAFHNQIELAARLDLPLSVHSRAAGRHALDQLSESQASVNGPVRACMHAFDGRAVYAERALQSNGGTQIYFSVPPCVVRSDSLAKMVKRLPLHRLLLESDAPALPAIVNTRNEPAEIVRSLNMIAGLKGVSVEHASEVINENTRTLFTRL